MGIKSSLGNPARGERFYPRMTIVKKIYRTLEGNAHIYLSAPRRVGKTSIMKHLEDDPKEGYCFVYVITESVYDSNTYFKAIVTELSKSKAVGRWTKLENAFKKFLSAAISNIKSIKGVELNEQKEPDYYDLLVTFFGKVQPEWGHVVLMIDEYPQTIHNIRASHGDLAATEFIRQNRALRQQLSENQHISFIYTGSIALDPLEEMLTGSLVTRNDVITIEVPPLTPTEAADLLCQLMQQENIILDDTVVQHALIAIRWHVPFHIQLLYAELINVYEMQDAQVITTAMVDTALQQVVDARNKNMFAPYFSRLKKLFKNDDYNFVMEVLKISAKSDYVDDNTVFNLNNKHKVANYKFLLQNLEADGYLYRTAQQYRYTSPILQLWCLKHICDEQ